MKNKTNSYKNILNDNLNKDSYVLLSLLIVISVISFVVVVQISKVSVVENEPTELFVDRGVSNEPNYNLTAISSILTKSNSENSSPTTTDMKRIKKILDSKSVKATPPTDQELLDIKNILNKK